MNKNWRQGIRKNSLYCYLGYVRGTAIDSFEMIEAISEGGGLLVLAYFNSLQKIIVNQNMLTGYFYIKMHILLIWNLTASHHFMLYAKKYAI